MSEAETKARIEALERQVAALTARQQQSDAQFLYKADAPSVVVLTARVAMLEAVLSERKFPLA